jgi:hypothetical protein
MSKRLKRQLPLYSKSKSKSKSKTPPTKSQSSSFFASSPSLDSTPTKESKLWLFYPWAKDSTPKVAPAPPIRLSRGDYLSDLTSHKLFPFVEFFPSRIVFPVCALRCCHMDKRPVMAPKLLEILKSPRPAIAIREMFAHNVVYTIPFESILAMNGFGADDNYFSIFISNISSYVSFPHKDAYLLFETPYRTASRVISTYQSIRSISFQPKPAETTEEFELSNFEQ